MKVPTPLWGDKTKRRAAKNGVKENMIGPASPSDRHSIWLKTSDDTSYPIPPISTEFDVAIIGAGIVGVALAHRLKDTGKRVALIEGERVLQGVTGYTTGKLTSEHGLIYHQIKNSLDLDHAKMYFEANEWAINEVRSTAAAKGINCDLTTEHAHVVIRSRESEKILEEEISTLREAGIPHEVFHGAERHHQGYAHLRFPNQAHFHPRQYLLALLKECADAGVSIFEQSRVISVEEKEDGCYLRLPQADMRAAQAVIATHYPIHDSGLFIAKLAPYRSYAMALRLNEAVPPGMFITHEFDLMHSSRPGFADGEPILLVGGGHHKVGQAEDANRHFRDLEDWAASAYDVKEVLARWSTQDNWTPDGRPFIGLSPNRDRIFVATGFGGWGMTTGIIAAQILEAGLNGEQHPWKPLYDPSRLAWDMVPKLVTENLNTAKHLIGDKMASTESGTPEKLDLNDAAVFESEDGRIAAYRDGDGLLHMVSADCTHMGCQLAWNNAERTWDCPCHGSRFSPDGVVIHGPATEALDKYQPKEIS